MFRHAQMHTIPKSLSHARATVPTKFPFQDHHLHPNGSLPLRRRAASGRLDVSPRDQTPLFNQFIATHRHRHAGRLAGWLSGPGSSSNSRGNLSMATARLNRAGRIFRKSEIALSSAIAFTRCSCNTTKTTNGGATCLLLGVNLCSIISCSLSVVTLLSLQVYELKIYQLLRRAAQRPRDGILFTRQCVHVFATECPQAQTKSLFPCPLRCLLPSNLSSSRSQ